MRSTIKLNVWWNFYRDVVSVLTVSSLASISLRLFHEPETHGMVILIERIVNRGNMDRDALEMKAGYEICDMRYGI